MNNTAKALPIADYRIYVASLSDYNAGRLHGVWIDCDGKGADELQDEVNAMLRESKYPNVTVEHPETGKQVPSAEEYAIHDHEGFGDLIGEFSSLSEIADILEALESADDPEALIAYADHVGGDLKDAVDWFEDAFNGQWASEQEFAEDLLESCYTLDEPLASYFDYEKWTRDLFMCDYFSVEADSGDVYVFRHV